MSGESDVSTPRALAHAHLGVCIGEHTKACDMLTVEFGSLFQSLAAAEAETEYYRGLANEAGDAVLSERARAVRAEGQARDLEGALAGSREALDSAVASWNVAEGQAANWKECWSAEVAHANEWCAKFRAADGQVAELRAALLHALMCSGNVGDCEDCRAGRDLASPPAHPSAAPLPGEPAARRDCIHGHRTCDICSWMSGYPAEQVLAATTTPKEGTP
jgi:hypothetical protein